MKHQTSASNDTTYASPSKSLEQRDKRWLSLMTPALFALPLLSASAQAQTCTTGNLLTDPQFAAGTPLGNYGSSTLQNQWLDENSSIETTTVNGVSPVTPGSGTGMLHMFTTGGVVSQTRQVIDVTTYASEINAGTLSIIAKATYNAPGAGSAGGFSVSTWDGSTLTIIPGSVASLSTDASAATWEDLEVCVQVPVGTTALSMDLFYSNGTIPSGGFIDQASLQLSSVANDDCDKPRDVSGLASFNFDTTCATTDGVPDILCDSFGQSNIENDLWFKWTAPADGDFLFSTCGTTWDTKIAVYADESAGGGSSCPTQPPLCCNDDACGLQAELCCPGMTQGTSYLIRVGNFPGASPAGGIGTLTFALCVPPPQDCFSYWCFGDGSTVSPCSCGSNYSNVGDDAGCLNSTGQGAILRGFGSCSLSACDLTLRLSQLPLNQFGIIFSGLNQTDVIFGDGVRCVAGSIIRSTAMNSGSSGVISIDDVLCTSGLAGQFPLPGSTRHYQGWFRDPAMGCFGYNVSNAMTVTITP